MANNKKRGQDKSRRSNCNSRSNRYNKNERFDDNRSKSTDKYAKGRDRYEEEQGNASMKNPNIKSSARNDASWYTYSPDVLRVASAVNFNQAVGVPYSDSATHLWEQQPNKSWWATTPSLMCMNWTPLPGMAISTQARNATNSPLNLQMRSLYSYIQATVTQNLPFAAADLGIHLMFMDSVFLIWGHLQRFYYLYRVYKSMNTTIPKVFFHAYGLNPDDLFVGGYTIADYQADMLSLQQEMRRIAVPDGFDILNRHYWMSKHVFKDDDVVRSQYYMFVPNAVWHFDAEGATGGELKLHKVPDFYATGIKGMITFFRQLLSSYYNDENIWNLNGYILRAFNKFWVADDFQLDAVYEPQYVPEVLMQIHNATVTGDCVCMEDNFQGDFAMIYQDSQDNVVCDPAVHASNMTRIGHMVDERIMFDMPTDSPSDGDIMVASRLIVRGTPYQITGTSNVVVRLQSFGTEVLNKVFLYDGVNDIHNAPISYNINIYDEGGEGVIVHAEDFIRQARLSKFSGAPIYPYIFDHRNSDGTTYTWGWFDYVGDLRNYVIFETKTLSKLHDAAAMGEWYIKQ